MSSTIFIHLFNNPFIIALIYRRRHTSASNVRWCFTVNGTSKFMWPTTCWVGNNSCFHSLWSALHACSEIINKVLVHFLWKYVFPVCFNISSKIILQSSIQLILSVWLLSLIDVIVSLLLSL